MKPGERKVEVFTADGKVVFGTSKGNYVFDPATAVSVGNAFLHAAADLGVDIKFDVERPGLTSMQHMALLKRAEHILHSLRGKPDAEKAKQIVDTVLAAVL